MTGRTIEAAIRTLLRARAAERSICPSEVARALAPDGWRPLMGPVREAAARMARSGEVLVTQRGVKADPLAARGPIRITASTKVAYANAYRGIDFRKEPQRYRVGRGEEGVLIAEPYKRELLPLWRFKTPEVAKASSTALWKAFVAYRRARDFVGMDMARKYLQMGFTRARRYANHRTGRKYDEAHVEAPDDPDPVKAAAAAVFYGVWQKAERDRSYRAWRRAEAGRRSPRS